jgi:hypothetical protein
VQVALGQQRGLRVGILDRAVLREKGR